MRSPARAAIASLKARTPGFDQAAAAEDLGLDTRRLAEIRKVAKAGGMDFANAAITACTEAPQTF